MEERLEALIREICGLQADEPVTEKHRQTAIEESREAIRMYLKWTAEIDRQMAELQEKRAEYVRAVEANQADHQALTGKRYKPRP